MFNINCNRNKPNATEKSIIKRQSKAHPFGIKGLSAALLIGCTLLSATGCQKTEEPPVAESDVGAATAPANNDAALLTSQKADEAQKLDKNGMKVEQEAMPTQGGSTPLLETEKQRIDEQADPSLAATNLSADESEVFLEKQITAVDYRNESGNSLKVTFQTSALAALEADVLLPSGKRILLTAPKDEGNNPTYRSSDGSVELVTHGGGGSIDLVSNGKSSSFDAVSAEAEVIAPPK